MPKISARRLAIVGLSSLIPLLQLISPASSLASGRQVSIFQDGAVGSNPGPTVQELRHLGANTVRIQVNWANLAPSPASKTRPNFDATNPGAYPASGWAGIDGSVRAASANGISVLLTVTGGAPAWAEGPGKPGGQAGQGLAAWKPSAAEFGKFVKAVVKRYGGGYRPSGQSSALPRVGTWEIWNEPNFVEDLAPLNTSPAMYRALVAAAWPALRGHGTVLLGAMGAYVAGFVTPLKFVRQLYCVDGGYHALRGAAAKQQSCPTGGGFRGKNPALFSAGGFSMHPYPLSSNMNVPPTGNRIHNPDVVPFSRLPNLIKTLDSVTHVYRSGKHFNVINDEYGYITNPPAPGGVSLANQAYYLNWAEYLSWKNPRIGSFDQFLLTDPPASSPGHFDSGLLNSNGAPKPAYDAWRLPLYLPSASTRKGRSLEVWGCVRPAPFAAADTGQAQVGHIQFRANGSKVFKDVATTRLRGNCYFDLKVKFPSSGTVRLSYQYPLTDLRLRPTIGTQYIDPLASYVSRSVSVTVR
jgi:hypothetical protein